MKLKELYNKPIDRAVNPAVSATKFDPETERIEIQEYVFTDEIMNGLFRILAYIIHSGFISGYQNRYGDNLKPPTNV
uniref:hypothetical protein n=1 Tax=Bacteroides cellulosilyticus TaxID=246787 RepID=UPI0032EFCC47